MTIEVVKKVEAYDSFNTSYTVADGTQISQGILLKVTDPRTAAKMDGLGLTPAAGISSVEKEANDGATKNTAWTKGIFKGQASGAINVGMPIAFCNDNYIIAAPPSASGAIVAGYALETAADGDTFVFKMDL